MTIVGNEGYSLQYSLSFYGAWYNVLLSVEVTEIRDTGNSNL